MKVVYVLVEKWADGVTEETVYPSASSAVRAGRATIAEMSELLWSRIERRVDGIRDDAHRIPIRESI